MCIYTDTGWLDRLTSYNGATISYDDIGNPISYNNGSAYTFAWENGREMSLSYHNGILTTYEYGADGLRTQKTYGSTTYNYYYADGQLIRQTWGTHYIDFLYDETGSVYSIINDGTQYYFVKNLQGDVVQIRSVYGTVVVEYTYAHGRMCCPLPACMRTPWGKTIRSDTADITKILRRASTIYRADTMTPPSEGLLTRIMLFQVLVKML